MKASYHNRARPVELWEIDEGALGLPGATWLDTEQAWNFALYSRHATGVTLLLYDATNFVKPVVELRLDPLQNKTGRIWHCFVRGSLRRRAILRLPGGRPWDPGEWTPVRRGEGVTRSICRGAVFSAGLFA